MARKKVEIPGPPTVAAWLGTYGDMVTLVLTFFVLLFSFSTIDAAKWQQVAQSLSGKTPTFVSDGAPLDIPEPPAVVDNPSDVAGDEKSDQSWHELFDSLQKAFKQKEREIESQTGVKQNIAEFEETDSEIVIMLPERLLFDPGKYNLKPDAVDVLEDLALMIDPKLEQIASILIEGHTDTVPIYSPPVLLNNWDLGYQRAQAVFTTMRESYPFLPPNMFTCVSLGEEHPVFDAGNEFQGDERDRDAYKQWVDSQNVTAEQRARNRRCVIILKRNHAYSYVDGKAALEDALDTVTDVSLDMQPETTPDATPEATPDATVEPASGTDPEANP